MQQRDIAISMSRKGNPYDNAKLESFMKTLKVEEVYLNEYETEQDARENIARFIETIYNIKRLHSSWAIVHRLSLKTNFIHTKQLN